MTTAPYPPGPIGLPLLGHVREFRRDARALMTSVARDYGPVAEIRLGPQRMYLLSRSEEIADVRADGFARRLPRFAYFPYGGGARICIARAFVHQQLVLALATIARRYRFEPAPGHAVIPNPETALSMRYGLEVIVRRR